MAAAPTSARYTPEELLALPDGHRFELVRGELVERHMSNESSKIGFEVNRRLGNFIADHHSGLGFQSDCGLQIFPWDKDLVRYADGVFLSADRVPPGVPGRGHLRIAPDLVFEVVAPGDIVENAEQKVVEYLRAGVKLIWTIIPAVRSIRIDRVDGTGGRLGPGDTLDGEDILPGFSVAISDLLPGPDDAS
jgi:Uma2 family endonuclease